ncbi:sodium-dependent transporter [Candidatus Woesearchaeota archaeon]|nr:sodium-dependent transporter [Candidatus Woesearchaeota archaeon]
MQRDRWPTRLTFLFAAVTSAIGLGAVWRFPYLTYKYGGGAFLLPYLIALVVAGIPLLILEFALGQKLQKGAVDALASIKRKFSFIGWWALFIGFIVISYYSVVMGWSIIYFFTSIGTQWGDDPKAYFFNNILHLSDSINNIEGITDVVFIALVAGWIGVYFSVWKGTKSVSKVVNFTTPFALVLFLIMLVRAVTLKGSMEGLIYYLKPNFSALLDAEVWIAAFSQIFFQLSVGFGVMIAYASFNDRKEDISKNAVVVGVATVIFSILAGFIIFGTLGFMASSQNVPIEEVVASGPGLAFVVFPKALSLMPFASFFSMLFFLILVTIAYDSAFSLVEAIDTVIVEKTKMKREAIALIVCIFGLLSGIIFTTNAGLYFLDVIDHFINSYSLVAVGILECIAVGWVFGAEKLRAYVNKVSDIKIGRWWDYAIKYFVPIVLTIIVAIQLTKEFKAPYENYPQWAIWLGWISVVVPFAIAFLIPQKNIQKKNIEL